MGIARRITVFCPSANPTVIRFEGNQLCKLFCENLYFVQLTHVAPRIARGQIEGIEVFLFVPFNSFLYAVDILGYSFMSVSTLFAAPVFTGSGLPRVVRLFLTANGLLLPFIALQMYAHPLIWVAALWAVTFPGSTWSLAILFRRAVPQHPAVATG